MLFKRATLPDQIPEGLSEYEVSQQYKHVLDELSKIDDELTVGTSVVIALIHNSKLYIGNIGTCRALLCKNDENNVLRVTQLSVDHDLSNPDEEQRLKALGLDVKALKQSNGLYATRCIGNYMGKAGYKDSTYLSGASSEPVLSVPEIVGPIKMDESCRFLILMSKGLCKTLVDIFEMESSLVNKEVVKIAVEYFRSQTTLMGVAQSVVNNISLQHYDTFMEEKGGRFNSRDDMTLLIRNFNYPIPNGKRPSQSRSASDTNSTVISETYTTTNSTTTSEYNGLYVTQDETRQHKVMPYVDFSEYYKLVEEAKAKGTLPKGIDFD